MLALLVGLWLLQAGPAPPAITLAVDARDASRSLFHVTARLTCAQGPLKLFDPKFIPGEHGPTGPINSVIRLRLSAGGATLAWKRDPINVYEIDTQCPAGGVVTIDFDNTFALPTLFGEIGSATLSRVKWNRLVWYPGPEPSDGIQVVASITLPADWVDSPRNLHSGSDGCDRPCRSWSHHRSILRDDLRYFEAAISSK